jgi:L-ectoine synthase
MYKLAALCAHPALRGFSEMKMACVFNPPLYGNEVHRADGSYATTADVVGE